MTDRCPGAGSQFHNRQTDRQHERRLSENRQLDPIAQCQRCLVNSRNHDCLLSLRTCSISARSASSSSSVHVSSLSNAAAVLLGEPPKKTRTSLFMALRWAAARDLVGE